MFLHERMAQRHLGLDLVAVATAMSLAQDIALLNQLGKDFVGTSLGDADRSGDVAQSDAGIVGNAKQDVGVVREEVPAGGGFGCLLCNLSKYSRIYIHESR